MNERGQYGNSAVRSMYARAYYDPCERSWDHTVVGLKAFHTMGDSDRATRSIDVEMSAIMDAMYRAMGADPSVRKPPFTFEQTDKMSKHERDTILGPWKERVLAAKAIATKSPLWPFFDSAVSPTFEEWQAFRGEHEYYNLFTSWEEYEKWLERAKQLRAAVMAKGVRVETPEPLDLTKTLGAEAAGTLGDIGKGALSIVKWGVIGALAIGGVFALTSAVSHLRKGTDPVETFRRR